MFMSDLKLDPVQKEMKIKDLKSKFFAIGGNYEGEALEELQRECREFLIKNYDEEIADLVEIMEVLAMYIDTFNRDLAREQLKDIWQKLIAKDELTLYEIRILNPLLFAAANTEELIAVTNKCLDVLERRYRFDKLYIRLRMVLLLNLVRTLIDDKFFSNDYKEEYDALIESSTDEIIELNSQTDEKYGLYVAFATVHRGMVMKDKVLFRVGIAFLEQAEIDFIKLDKAIALYMERYNFKI